MAKRSKNRKKKKLKKKNRELKPSEKSQELIIKTRSDWIKKALIKQSRLSVMPIDMKSWKILNKMSNIQ